MKHLFLIPVFLLSFTACAQNIALWFPEQRILYRQHNNLLQLTAPDGTDYWLETNDTSAYIERRALDQYIIRPGKGTRILEIVIKAREGTDTLVKGMMHFRVSSLPNPNIYWGVFPILPAYGLQDVKIRKLIEMDVFFAKYPPELLISASFEVTKVVLRIGNTQVINEGKRLSEATKELLRTAPEGTLVLIESVEISGPDGIRRLGGSYFEVH